MGAPRARFAEIRPMSPSEVATEVADGRRTWALICRSGVRDRSCLPVVARRHLHSL